jgi:aldehyde dehydrogenase (NAD+)
MEEDMSTQNDVVKAKESVWKQLELKPELPGAFGPAHLADDPKAPLFRSSSPIDQSEIALIVSASAAQYDQVVSHAQKTAQWWRTVPAPRRGELVRQIGLVLREQQDALGTLITLEMGKILAEGRGEVQEAIDIADFAVGLSRQLYGNTMHSERPGHRMYEQWHPLGVVGVITAFNFPMAVWAWNAMLAVVCGNAVVWKPSELTPVCAIALNSLCRSVAKRFDPQAEGLFSLVVGSSSEFGKKIAADTRIPLVSATGSCAMGRSVGVAVADRLGKSLLELGGNNAVIVAEDADMKLVVRSTLFGAVGTAGQRCTTTRRVLIHSSRKQEFLAQMKAAYEQIRIGNPLDPQTLLGPLIHERSVQSYLAAIKQAKVQGGSVVYGGRVLSDLGPLCVQPSLIDMPAQSSIVREETFAPLLYVMSYNTIEEALVLHNDVPQGLSSALFTQSLRTAERFLGAGGSDCGIANINLGTSGAEIGGAFGGEKDTGGGRESGSDSWRAYMRRQTNTINFSNELPLAQGIQFDI